MFSNAGDSFFASGMMLFFLPYIFNLLLAILGIYFVIKVTKFMNVKTKLDRERNEKIDELIKVINQSEKTK
ncbi:MAG TPA: hypothetical protein VGI04_00510 [Neobacillus sp.]|jgi:Na+/phosphate symporter